MQDVITLAQTLSLDWVITVPNPEELDWLTELARFETSATADGSDVRDALEASAALTVQRIAAACLRRIKVTSHITKNAKAMQARVDIARTLAGER
jgi:hypothetical protein